MRFSVFASVMSPTRTRFFFASTPNPARCYRTVFCGRLLDITKVDSEIMGKNQKLEKSSQQDVPSCRRSSVNDAVMAEMVFTMAPMDGRLLGLCQQRRIKFQSLSQIGRRSGRGGRFPLAASKTMLLSRRSPHGNCPERI